MVLGGPATALVVTALWIVATWLIGLPLVFLPLAMSLGVGATVGALHPAPGRTQGVFAAGVALVHGILGSMASTLLLAIPPERLSTFTNTWTYLRAPGWLRNVISRTFTPMDVMIYAFIAGTAYAMVMYMARRKTPRALPVGEPVATAPESPPSE
jgi:hypothetical protein